jgi:hypothetical protein
MYSMNLPGMPPVYEDREPVIYEDSVDLYESGADTEPPPEGPMDVSKRIDWPDGDDDTDGGYDDDEDYADDDDDDDDDDDEPRTDESSGGGGPQFDGQGNARPYPLPGELLITPGGGELRWQADLEEGN